MRNTHWKGISIWELFLDENLRRYQRTTGGILSQKCRRYSVGMFYKETIRMEKTLAIGES